MYSLLSDPWFYAFALPAVALIGLSKGGLGGAPALMGVPLMALAVPPVQAAAILLPILVVMDLFALWSWRGHRDPLTLRNLLPGAMIGIGIGWFTAAIVTADMVRLIVGAIAFLFALQWLLTRRRARNARHSLMRGTFWGIASGFTSFVAHAGGPPYQVYTLPLGQDPKLYTGTNVTYFAIVNAIKLLPYFALGQFDSANLQAAAVLMPVAPLTIFAGAWIVRRMNQEIFYPVMYVTVLIVGAKLLWDGMAAMLP
jgi:uncharacterized membrane protein YfcA